MFVAIKCLCKGNAVALRYLLYSVGLLLLACTAIDAFVIPTLEDWGKIASTGWKDENEKLLHYMHLRNKADDKNPVWRSDLFPVQAEKTKTKRILVMGDSYVWGHGYANLNTIWWRQLQLELERRGYRDVEVVGAGMRGAATWRELAWAKKLVPEYKPDLVVWGFVNNDPDEGEQIEAEGGKALKALIVPKDTVFPERVSKVMEGTFPNLSEQLFAVRKKLRGEQLAGDKYGYQFGDWEQLIVQGSNFDRYKQTVKKVADFSRQSSIPSFVIDFPNAVTFASKSDTNKQKTTREFFEGVRSYYASRYAPVKAAFVACGMPFYDILDDYIDYAMAHSSPGIESSKFAFLINPVNSHPGPMATHFYAVKAADYIETHYPNALGKRTFNGAEHGPRPVINDCVPPDVELRQNKEHAFFVYPPTEDNLLSMPIRKPFVLMNLERPVPLKELKVIGEQLQEANLYLTLQEPNKGYDEGLPVELGSKRGSSLHWNIPDRYASCDVSSIRIAAKFKGPHHGVILDMIPNGAAR